MARKKVLDDDEQQENRGTVGGGVPKSIDHRKSPSPPHSAVLGIIQNQRRNGSHVLPTNQNSVNNPSSDSSLTVDETLYSIIKQLSKDGLTIREMPGDGNCLFRALSDQLEGNTRNHLKHRKAVVSYMRENRDDFEPFVEDDQPFEKYTQSLAQPGTFAGNDAIVAFARLHDVTVVIHQLNSPAWLIHPTSDAYVSSRRELHIAYHNGDHYNSVRKIGDDSDAPSNIRLMTTETGTQPSTKTSKSNNMAKQLPGNVQHNATCPSTVTSENACSSFPPSSVVDAYEFTTGGCGGRDEDYWVKDVGDIERLVQEVLQQTDYPDPVLVRETLIDYNFDMTSTIDFILSMSYYMSEQDQTNLYSFSSEVPPSTNSNNISSELKSFSANSSSEIKEVADANEDNVDNNANITEDNAQSKIQPTAAEPGKDYVANTVSRSNLNINSVEENVNKNSIKQETAVDVGGDSCSRAGGTCDSPDSQYISANSIVKPQRSSARHKKDQKRRERKRESDRRKKAGGELSSGSSIENSSPPRQSQEYSLGGVRTLNI